jgi:O-antigen/teichoic acid export membrane protein
MIPSVQDRAQPLFRPEAPSGSRQHLARDTAGTFGLRVATTALSFAIGVLLSRLLGTAGFGAYAYAMAWVAFLGTPALLGLDQLLVRNVAAYQELSAWGLMAGLLRWANRAALMASLGIASLAAVVAWALATRLDARMLSAIWVVLFLLPLVVIARLMQATMQGLHCVVVGLLPQTLLYPLLFILLLGGIYLFQGRGPTAPWAVGLNGVASVITLLVGLRLLRCSVPKQAKEAPPQYRIPEWMRSALPILLVSSLGVVNGRADIILLGSIKGAAAVGVYGVAQRGPELITFLLTALSAPLAPVAASLYARGDIEGLQRVVTKGVRAIFFAALPIALGFILFGRWFLLLFGPDFVRGQTALAILTGSQLCNATMGPVLMLLVMTGHERDAAVGMGIGTALNLILNAVLIPRLGLEGAAIATASSTIAWTVVLAACVFRRTGIHATALGRIGVRREP